MGNTNTASNDIYADPDPNIEYDCTPGCKSKGFTKLMKWVLLTRTHPELLQNIKKYVSARDINAKNAKGVTALMLTARNSNTWSTNETVKLLLEAGANINLQDKNGWTALMYAALNSNADSTNETVKLLLEAGANVNLRNNNGWTALMFATRYSNTTSTNETVKLLLDGGAQIDLQNSEGFTALMNATGFSCTDSTNETVKLLLNAKANINLGNNNNETALMFAAYNSNKNSTTETVKLLLDAGAHVNLQGNNGLTPLMHATTVGAMELLINAHADINIQNNAGQVFLDLIEHDGKLMRQITNIIMKCNEEMNNIIMIKKMNFQYVLKNIPIHRNKIMFSPGHLGCVITELSFDIRRSNPGAVYEQLKNDNHRIIGYLDIMGESDLVRQISAFMFDVD